MAWTSPRTWVAGEVVTAALLNAHLRDNLLELNSTASAWTAYTPTLTNGTLGDGTLVGRYKQVGKSVLFSARFTLGSTSAVASNLAMNLPVTAATTANMDPGGVETKAFDSSTGEYRFGGTVGSFSAAALVIPTVHGVIGAFTSATPWTWATGDYIQIAGTYEAA